MTLRTFIIAFFAFLMVAHANANEQQRVQLSLHTDALAALYQQQLITADSYHDLIARGASDEDIVTVIYERDAAQLVKQLRQDNPTNQLPANGPVLPQDGDIRTQIWQRIENNMLFRYTLEQTYRVQGGSGRWVTTLTSKQYIKDVPPKAADGID